MSIYSTLPRSFQFPGLVLSSRDFEPRSRALGSTTWKVQDSIRSVIWKQTLTISIRAHTEI
jgi:hypothetical protein